MESRTTASIFTLIHTTVDRAACLSVLDQYESGLFQKVKTAADECFTPFFQEHLGEGQTARTKASAIRAQILKAPVVRVSVAFEPDDTFTAQLSNSIRSLSGNPETLLEVTIDETILGGIVLTDSGKILDFSLAKKLEKMELERTLSHYLPTLNS